MLDSVPAAEMASDTLVLSPAFGVEKHDASTVTIFSATTGARLRIPRALRDRIRAFQEPCTIASVAGDDARLSRAISQLRSAGILVDPRDAGVASAPPLVTDPPVRLFDCPAHKRVAQGIDIVVIGIPYDGGDHDAAGVRHGPARLRETSLQFLYALDTNTDQPRGWYDVDVGRQLLRGVTIGDGGDVLVVSGEPQGCTFERATRALNTLAVESGITCAVLGGDSTTGFPLIEAVQARGPVGILRIGNLPRGLAPPKSPFLSPSTLPHRVLKLPSVDTFVQVGVLGPVLEAPRGFSAITVAEVAEKGVAALAPYIATGSPIHFGLDISILTRPLGQGGMSTQRSHFSYRVLRKVIADVGNKYRIVSIELTGVNPLLEAWGVTGMTATHLLLAMLSAAVDRDHETTSW